MEGKEGNEMKGKCCIHWRILRFIQRGLWALFGHSMMTFIRGVTKAESCKEFMKFLVNESKTPMEGNNRYHDMIKSVFFDVPRFIYIQVINLPTLYKPRKDNRTFTLFNW